MSRIKLILLMTIFATSTALGQIRSDWTVYAPGFTYNNGKYDAAKKNELPSFNAMLWNGERNMILALKDGPITFIVDGSKYSTEKLLFEAFPEKKAEFVSAGKTKDATSLFLDDAKTLWFGTEKGLYAMPINLYSNLEAIGSNPGLRGTYYTEKTPGMPFKRINEIVGGTKGEFYVSGLVQKDVLTFSPQGVSRFDGSTWTNLVPTDHQDKSFSILTADQNGSIWMVMNDNEVVSLTGESWKFHGKPGSKVTALTIGSEGEVVAGQITGISILKNGKWEKQDIKHASSPTVRTAAYDKTGTLWVALASNGVVGIAKNGNQLVMTESNSGLHGSEIYTIYVDENNKKWFVTNSGAVVGFKEAPVTTDKIDIINKMNSEFDDGFIVDAVKYNNTWYLVHDNLGLCSLEGGTFKVITPKGDRGGFHYGVSVTKSGKVYMATNRYLHTWDGSKYEKMTIENGDITRQINDVLIDRNEHIWITHNKGVARFNGSDWELFTKKGGQLSSASGENLFEDSKGNIWIDGSTRFDGTTWTTYNKKNGGFNVDGEMAETPDGKFVTSNGWAFYEFDGTTWTQRKDVERITGGINNMIISKDGSIWIATNERGILKSSKGVSTFCDASNCNLYDNHVSYVFGDENGIWISNGKKPAPPTPPASMGQPGQEQKTPPPPTEKEVFESKLSNFDPQHALIKVKTL